jgi:calcium/calmodulin dependent protein kinase II association protein
MTDSITEELLALTQRLLECISTRDWDTYQQLCDPSLTCFEPEALGQRVEGLGFHNFYFRLGGGRREHNTTLTNPHVRLMGDVAVVTYVRLNQRVDGDGRAGTAGFEETRVWERREGTWHNVHFHRSSIGETR